MFEQRSREYIFVPFSTSSTSQHSACYSRQKCCCFVVNSTSTAPALLSVLVVLHVCISLCVCSCLISLFKKSSTALNILHLMCGAAAAVVIINDSTPRGPLWFRGPSACRCLGSRVASHAGQRFTQRSELLPRGALQRRFRRSRREGHSPRRA